MSLVVKRPIFLKKIPRPRFTNFKYLFLECLVNLFPLILLLLSPVANLLLVLLLLYLLLLPLPLY